MAEDEGRKDDDAGTEGDEDQDDDAGTGGDDEDDDSDEYTPPDKAEWQKVQGSLTKIKAERAAARKELRELKAAKEKDGDKDDKPADDPDAKVKRLAGVAALAAEGLTKAQAKVAVRLLDLDDVDVDDDGDADLDDAIAELKETFPGLFAKGDEGGGNGRRPRTGGGRPRGSGKDGAVTSDDRNTARLLKAAGYR